MSEDLKGRIDLDVSGATNALEKARRAFRDLSVASTQAGKAMSASQQAAAKNVISSYQSLRVAQSKVVDDAISLNRRLKEVELKGAAERRLIRARAGLEDAKAGAVTATSGSVVGKNNAIADSSRLVAANQAELIGAKKVTEQRRQQVMLADAAARRASEGIRNELAQQKALMAQQRAANAMHDQTNSRLAGMRYAVNDVSRGLGLMGTAGVVAAVGVLGMAVAWEKSFADVLRTNMGMKDTAVEAGYLKDQFRDLVTTLPVSWSKLTEIGTLAGQLGIAKSAVADFTKTTAMFSATTDVSVDATATAFGRLDALLPSVKGNYKGLADSILKVGVNSVATESQIIKITTQLASIAGPIGYTYQQVIGLSGALASVGAPPELSRGTLQRTFGQVGRAISENGAALDKWGMTMGMSGKEFKQAWNEDASGTFVKFMGKIHTAGADADQILRELGITSVRDVPLLKRLALAADSTGKAGGLLAQTMKDAGLSTGELARQYEIISNTSGAKLQVLFQNIQSALEEIGSTQLGGLNTVVEDVTKSVRDFSRGLEDNVRVLDLFELDATNGQLAGTAAVMLGGVGVAALLVAGLGHVATGYLAIRQVAGQVRSNMAASSAAMAANANAARATGLAYGGMNRGFAQSAGVLGTMRNGFNRASSAVVGLGAAIGPQIAIMAAFAAVAGAVSWASELRNAGSSATEAGNAFLVAKDSLDLLNSIQVNNFDNLANTNFKPFITDMDQLGQGLRNIEGNGFFSDFSHKWNDLFRSGDKADATTFDTFSSGLAKLDAGFADLVSSGNPEQAVSQMQGLIKGANLSSKELDTLIEKMPEFKHHLQTTLSGQEMESSKKNMRELALGNVELKNAMVEAAGVDTEVLASNFNDSSDEALAFLGTVGKAIQAAGDMSTGYQNTIDSVNEKGRQSWVAAGNDISTYVDVATVSFGDYLATMQQRIQEQADLAKNLALIAIRGGTEVAEAMAGQSAEVIAAAAGSTEEEFGQLVSNLDLLSADAASLVTANIASITPEVIAEFTRLGGGSRDEFVAAITDGTRTVQQVMDDLRNAQTGNPLKLDLNSDLAKTNAEAFRQEIMGQPPVMGKYGADTNPANENVSTFVNGVRIAEAPKHKVDADTDPAKASVENLKNGITGAAPADAPVDANTNPASGTMTAWRGLQATTVGITPLDANTNPASGSVERWRGGVRSTTTDTQVGANTAPATGAVNSFVNQNNGRTIGINVTISTGAAYAAIAGLRDQASRPINVGEFATGGYTGPGGRMQPAGIVHKGEFVMTKKATERIGVGNLYGMMAAAQRGYAGGGEVAPASNSYVHSTNGSSNGRGGNGGNNGGVQIVDFSAQAAQILADALNLQVIIPGAAIAKATSLGTINASNRRNA